MTVPSIPSPAPLVLVRDSDSASGTESGRRAYRSPEGTFEPVLKAVLEDWTLTDAERSLLLYMATKPGGWKFYTGQLTRTIPRAERTIRRVLASLVRKEYLTKERIRESGTFSEFFYLLRRDRVLAVPGDKSAGQLQCAENASLELTCENVSLPRSNHSAGLPHSGDLADIANTDLISEDSQDQSEAQRAGESPAPETDDWLALPDEVQAQDWSWPEISLSPRRVTIPAGRQPPAPKPRAALEHSAPREAALRAAIHRRWPGDGQSGLRQAVFYACTDRAHGFPAENPHIVAQAVAEVAATYTGAIQYPKGWLQHERKHLREAIDRLKAEREREERRQREAREQRAREEAAQTCQRCGAVSNAVSDVRVTPPSGAAAEGRLCPGCEGAVSSSPGWTAENLSKQVMEAWFAAVDKRGQDKRAPSWHPPAILSDSEWNAKLNAIPAGPCPGCGWDQSRGSFHSADCSVVGQANAVAAGADAVSAPVGDTMTTGREVGPDAGSSASAGGAPALG